MDLDSGHHSVPAIPVAAVASTLPAHEKVARYLDGLRREQNFGAALAGGLLAALVAGGLWAAVTVAISVHLDWMALGVAALVGYAVRLFGKGLDLRFGLLALVLTLLGCLVADLAAAYLLAARQFGLSVPEVLALIRFEVMRDFLEATFTLLTAVFHGVALVVGYNFAFRHIVPAELAEVAAG